RAAGESRPRAARHERDALAGQEPQDGAHFRGRPPQHDHLGRGALRRVAVALVDEQRLGTVDDAVRADDRAETRDEPGGRHARDLYARITVVYSAPPMTGIAGQLTPPRRRLPSARAP